MTGIQDNANSDRNSYEFLNITAKEKGFALSEDGGFLLICQRTKSKIARTLVDISKLAVVAQETL
jgi:hypothetical protein